MIEIIINGRKKSIEDGKTICNLIPDSSDDSYIVTVNGFVENKDYTPGEGDEIVLIKRGYKPGEEDLEIMMTARHTPGIYPLLKKACVGIAGAGGLGSNVAVSLARCGVGHLIIADFDIIEPSNLNRQHYFLFQIGQYKVEALKENISIINPFVKVTPHIVKLDRENIPNIFSDADVIVEAFDGAEMKVMIAETVFEHMSDKYLITGSGMAGYGKNELLHTRKLNRFYICGDETSEASQFNGLMAPRVAIVANMQANLVLEILIDIIK